ncbi:MAG TPA: response regulator [Phycisphaerales bacterium]|nr:response regulator [Phycisphaerales bacterium]
MPGKKVLIADDEIHIVQVVSIKLRNNGFDVLTADNGQTAYQLACDEEPDLIVTDYQMPEMSGIELIESIRKNPDIADTPIVMLTARGFAIDEKQKEELKISACLSKPFSPRELLQSVTEIITQRASA